MKCGSANGGATFALVAELNRIEGVQGVDLRLA